MEAVDTDSSAAGANCLKPSNECVCVIYQLFVSRYMQPERLWQRRWAFFDIHILSQTGLACHMVGDILNQGRRSFFLNFFLNFFLAKHSAS